MNSEIATHMTGAIAEQEAQSYTSAPTAGPVVIGSDDYGDTSAAEVMKVTTEHGDVPKHIVLAEKTKPYMKGIINLYGRWKHAAEALYSMNANAKTPEQVVSVDELLEKIDNTSGEEQDDDADSFDFMIRWSVASERTSNVKIGDYFCQLCNSICNKEGDVDICSNCGLTGCWSCLVEVPTSAEPVGRLLCEECRMEAIGEKLLDI
jgi:hypothetical protein